MKTHNYISKFLAVLITIVFAFESLPEINNHSHSTGFSNFHQAPFSRVSCFFAGPPIHMSYDCGKTFHL
ncbi:hypothetical protein [Psychroserpens mesophilus]|uniref:hypothetical protein n=1 Tax=Psychroserpens mesophilus TaxID=325473 RepID=UPI00058B5482|nr:hypothetical protein [Psychroserpens mesophilus]